MFIDKPDLFLPWLEERLKNAKKEANAIKKILDSHGVPKRGKILDVCCGIGRHSVELAKLGHSVVGLDLAQMHIKRAKELAARKKVSRRVEFVVGDMRDVYSLTRKFGKFDAAINMFTSFGFYDEKADLKLFKDVAKLCKNKAVLILDAANRDWVVRNFKAQFIDSVKNMEMHQFNRFNFETSFMENTWKFYEMDGEERRHLINIELKHRIYSAHELIKMLKACGWKDAKAHSSLELNPLDFSSLSKRLVVVAKR